MIERVIRLSMRYWQLALAAALALALWGAWSLRSIRIDAIPDLSDTQVILFSEWMGRSPELVEDQVTYPLVTSMLASPKVRVVRGFSMFGMSFVYVIFEDGTDLYWARSRVLETLSKLQGKLPQGVTPQMGPDATGVGWVYQYALVDKSGKNDAAAIRTFQDWSLRYWLSSVPGVAEVAAVGGMEKQYQIELDPARLFAYGLSVSKVVNAVRGSNRDVGARTLEVSEREIYVRGRGRITSTADLEQIAVGTTEAGTPIRIADLGRVQLGPNLRRGVSDLDGLGDTVGGVVVMRQGEDAATVIARVKDKIAEMKPAFPAGLELVTTYDRSDLIKQAVATLTESLIEEVAVVCLVILLFLLHLRSAAVVAIALPLTLLISMVPTSYLGIGLNIMSIGGLILAVGDIVDGIVVFIENTHKKLADDPTRDRKEAVTEACSELGPGLFSSLLIIAVSFLPIFALQAEEGRLFHPLAWTKTLAMLAAALVTVAVAPPLIWLMVRGRVRAERENPINRAITALYRPVLSAALRARVVVLVLTALLVTGAGAAFTRLGSEFMPPLWEGSLLYMPITLPGVSVTAATDLLQRQDAALRAVPEVASVFGKAGRFDTATDPSPLSMIEATIQLKPKDQWRPGLTEEELVQQLDLAVAVPGLNRAWTKPVRGRIDMLSTGIRTQVGIKVFGKDLEVIEHVGQQIERALRDVPGTRSVYAERIRGGSYLDFEPDRAMIARHGLLVGDVLDVLESAVGGMEVAQVIEARERYTVNVRYPRELRDTLDGVGRVQVKTPAGAQVPLSALGRLELRPGAPMILDEDGALAGYVYVDLVGRDTGGYVRDAKAAVEKSVHRPPGTWLKWTGQYENLERMEQRMTIVLPVTLVLVFVLLYLALRSTKKTLLVMLSVPLSLTGGILLMWALGYSTSVAVWAGAIALIGVAVETTAIMVVFLDEAWRKRRAEGGIKDAADVREATMAGALKSLRPVLMAVLMNVFGLIPVMGASGVGADVMKRLASPMFGGLVTLTLLTLVVVPVVYSLIERREPAAAPRSGDGQA
ncbi:MAG: efflux RND transporter permease subunit [Deltaproteobacteria bacterium]|nr:efflux RND transporter permease subunit [Deltaproteobacteria bacterium]